ncbi:prephenate dehydratase [Rhodovibrio sodomensis]|uniref:prephenate dehydratase n=1 Tax=Rhodovibrio sodomensis TaxID=1088 RepID=A0ABS1DD39_9PROT|nr:prephenate dehydratase [Rhodovibrio sodomensis]MBK1667852.1 prephenate dehydratase [Rhodovibrio sodomensis]
MSETAASALEGADAETDPQHRIAFQGTHGAYSDMACRMVFPNYATVPCPSFEDTFAAVREGAARYAMIPIDNSSAGRVADIHHLLPESGLHIVGEHFQPVNHNLLGAPGATLDGIRKVHSHIQALSQCRQYLRTRGLQPVVHADTAGAAAEVAERGDPAEAAIASRLAAEIYGLDFLASDIEDLEHNTTRFLIMAHEPIDPDPEQSPVVTSLVFRVRSVPAALYKALGGFATNGVNITKLESYILDSRFNVAQFYADVEGHPDNRLVRLALEELGFFSREVKILGVYPASPFREGAEAG